MARRSLANHRRGENRRAALTAKLRADLAQPSNSPAAAAFQQLAEPDREVLALTAWEGLTPAEIAVVLGCSTDPIDTIRKLDPLGSTPVAVSSQTKHALAEAVIRRWRGRSHWTVHETRLPLADSPRRPVDSGRSGRGGRRARRHGLLGNGALAMAIVGAIAMLAATVVLFLASRTLSRAHA